MTSQTARQIALAQQGSRPAMEQLLTENAPLLAAVARRYLSRGGEWEELRQLAAIGFYKAVMAFDLTRNTELSTYAVPKIMGEIRGFLREDTPLTLSRALRARALLVRGAQLRLEEETGQSPRLSALCSATGLSPEEVLEAMQAPFSAASLEEPFSSGEGSLAQVLSRGDPEETMVQSLDLQAALEGLEPRLRAVIALRFGRGLTQREAARALGVTQAHVSRLEKRALAALKEKLQ